MNKIQDVQVRNLRDEALAPFRNEVVIATKFGFNIQDGKMVGVNTTGVRKNVPSEHLVGRKMNIMVYNISQHLKIRISLKVVL